MVSVGCCGGGGGGGGGCSGRCSWLALRTITESVRSGLSGTYNPWPVIWIDNLCAAIETEI